MKRGFYLNDDIAIFDKFFDFSEPTFSLLRGDFYNPETHDLVPKPEYKRKQLKWKEDQLEKLLERKRNDIQLYEEQEKTIRLEIDTLRQALKAP